jgi:polyhydroxyalkanoate synthesis repressor PhaR
VPAVENGKDQGEKIVIKKYANRRLYNTARSSYVTLDDLAKMVRAGQDFAVYDAKTGEDITRSVLTQIIFEEEAKGQSMLPTNFLRQLIALYGDVLQGAVPSYLEASMEAFGQNQERIRQAFAGANPLVNIEAMTRGNMEWWEKAMRMFTPFGAAGAAGAKAPERPAQTAEAARDKGEKAEKRGPAEAPGPGDDFDDLQRQLAEMQAKLDRLTRGKR